MGLGIAPGPENTPEYDILLKKIRELNSKLPDNYNIYTEDGNIQIFDIKCPKLNLYEISTIYNKENGKTTTSALVLDSSCHEFFL